jgi:hypothetical protein
MRTIAVIVCALAAGCGPYRGHTPPPRDTLALQHLPSKEKEHFVSAPMFAEEALIFERRMHEAGWVLVRTDRSHPDSARLVLTFETPRNP